MHFDFIVKYLLLFPPESFFPPMYTVLYICPSSLVKTLLYFFVSTEWSGDIYKTKKKFLFLSIKFSCQKLCNSTPRKGWKMKHSHLVGLKVCCNYFFVHQDSNLIIVKFYLKSYSHYHWPVVSKTKIIGSTSNMVTFLYMFTFVSS